MTNCIKGCFLIFLEQLANNHSLKFYGFPFMKNWYNICQESKIATKPYYVIIDYRGEIKDIEELRNKRMWAVSSEQARYYFIMNCPAVYQYYQLNADIRCRIDEEEIKKEKQRIKEDKKRKLEEKEKQRSERSQKMWWNND